jgi:hypothetical protein
MILHSKGIEKEGEQKVESSKLPVLENKRMTTTPCNQPHHERIRAEQQYHTAVYTTIPNPPDPQDSDAALPRRFFKWPCMLILSFKVSDTPSKEAPYLTSSR